MSLTRFIKAALIILSPALLAACADAPVNSADPAPASAIAADSASLARLFDAYIEEWLPLNPLDATQFGDHRYDDRLANDLSPAHREQSRALYSKYLASARAVDADKLSEPDRLSLDIFRWELENRLALMENEAWLRPIHQLDTLPSEFALLGSGAGIHPFHTARDYDNFLQRIHGYTVWVDTAIANMREGVRRGVTQPRALMERTLPQLQAMLVDDPKKSIFYQPISNMPTGIAPADRTRLTAAYEQAIRGEVIPSYRKLYDYIKNEYLPHTRDTAGLWALPDGRAKYARLARWYTTTDMAPEEIHALGLTLIGEVKRQMEAIRSQVGFRGDLRALIASLKTDPKFFPFKSDEEIIAAYRGIGETVDRNVPQLFGVEPKARLQIRPIEAFRAEAASAHYVPGTRDGSRPGVFYVPVYDPRKFTGVGIDDLYLHEAVPGHHFQVSLQQELDLPRFRQYSFYSAYGEGWAVYGETLGPRLGVLTDPYQDLGRLIGELRGSTSLAVDTGIHVKGWTRDEAIRFFLDNAIGSEDLAVNRVERYMANPAQTLSYLIGERKILELRRRAETSLGSRFDIRAFHDEALKDGSMPLAVFEAKMERWMAAQK